MKISNLCRLPKGHISCIPATVLAVAIILLCLVPVFQVYVVLGGLWQGLPPVFADEGFYYAHINTVAEGYYNDGNPYFFEHRFDPPLVLFGGVWLSAIPLVIGLQLNTVLVINLIFWGLAFAVLAFFLYREFDVSSWLSVVGVVALFTQSYAHIIRPANLQPVYPFYFFFYFILARFIQEQSRKNILLLAFASASTCYLFSYLWQVVAVTLGLLLLYALVRKDWRLFKASLLSSTVGGLLGAPAVLYTFWLSHTSPFFWESIARFGLVYTHIPMAEIVYSGGWIGLVLLLIWLIYWRAQALRTVEFFNLCLFVSVGGLGLWITQGSNALTGLLVETGEHVRVLILPWLLFVNIIVGAHLWRQRDKLTTSIRAFSLAAIVLLAVVNIQYTYKAFLPFVVITEERREQWYLEQKSARLFSWLQDRENEPVVVWSDPNVPITNYLPIFTRHFTLSVTAAMWHLVSDDELRERYLVSQYFDNPTIEDLRMGIGAYLGRQDVHHIAKTRERAIKICRLLSPLTRISKCGEFETSIEILGEPFFEGLEGKFLINIKPNILDYLKKYHVSYILKDMTRNSDWHPERLGAKRVYNDEYYELYRLSQ
jgi:hypothetical protein